MSPPPESPGYLGVVPIALGIWRAWQLRGPARGAAAWTPSSGGALTVALVNLAQPLQRLSRLALPFLLVAVGVYILADTATDVIHYPSHARVPASHPAPGE